MSKWADFCISEVRYNSGKEYIEKVKVHIDNGDKLSKASIQNREDVISEINSGKTFITVPKNKDNEWSKGQEIHIITVDDVEYLRTDANSKKSDNLENLPEF